MHDLFRRKVSGIADWAGVGIHSGPIGHLDRRVRRDVKEDKYGISGLDCYGIDRRLARWPSHERRRLRRACGHHFRHTWRAPRRLALWTDGDLAGRRDGRLDHRRIYWRRNFGRDYAPNQKGIRKVIPNRLGRGCAYRDLSISVAAFRAISA